MRRSRDPSKLEINNLVANLLGGHGRFVLAASGLMTEIASCRLRVTVFLVSNAVEVVADINFSKLLIPATAKSCR